MTRGNGQRPSGPSNRTPDPAFEEKKAKARANMALALTIEGFDADGRAVCPSCRKAERGSNRIFGDGGFKCHKCSFYIPNAVDLLVLPRLRGADGRIVGFVSARTDSTLTVKAAGGVTIEVPAKGAQLEGGDWKFRDAIEALSTGKVVGVDGQTREIKPAVEVEPEFNSVPNPELYAAVLELGDVEAAQTFYGRWHISADVVADSRAVRITDQRALLKGLRERFSPEEMIAAGLATPEGHMLVNARYPVVEPHILPDGRVASLQFRAGEDTEQSIAAHKAYKKAKEAAVAAGRQYRGEKHKYVPKFLSILGAPITGRCGFGLPRIQQLLEAADAGDGTLPDRIYVVEGFKDVLAARTMGLEAYGLAGAGLLPVRAVCRMLGRFEVHVALDADEAGEVGRERLMTHFANHGVTAVDHAPPAGMDITDVLVDKVTKASATVS